MEYFTMILGASAIAWLVANTAKTIVSMFYLHKASKIKIWQLEIELGRMKDGWEG